VLEHSVPLAFGAGRLSLLFESDDSHSFLASQAKDPGALAILTKAASEHFGAPVSVSIEVGPRPRASGGVTLASLEADARRAREGKAREAVEKHPLVAAAVRIFGAELREVRLRASEE
jgi:hypothetical protein